MLCSFLELAKKDIKIENLNHIYNILCRNQRNNELSNFWHIIRLCSIGVYNVRNCKEKLYIRVLIYMYTWNRLIAILKINENIFLHLQNQLKLKNLSRFAVSERFKIYNQLWYMNWYDDHINVVSKGHEDGRDLQMTVPWLLTFDLV